MRIHCCACSQQEYEFGKGMSSSSMVKSSMYSYTFFFSSLTSHKGFELYVTMV